MKNNMSELTNKIMQEHESIAAFCAAADLNPEEFNQELSAGDLSIEHIEKAAQALRIPPEEIGFYFFRPAADPRAEEIRAMYEQLTPENKKLFVKKYYELLAEQEQEQAAQECTTYYYYFDCLDGVLSDRYLTAQELAQILKGEEKPLCEKEIKSIAANYEATLYRYTMDPNGNPQNEVCLYDPFDM